MSRLRRSWCRFSSPTGSGWPRSKCSSWPRSSSGSASSGDSSRISTCSPKARASSMSMSSRRGSSPRGIPNSIGLVDLLNRLADDLRNERTKLREQHHFLTSVLEASPSGVLVLNFDGRIGLANPAARRLLGDDARGAGLPGLEPAALPTLWAPTSPLRSWRARASTSQAPDAGSASFRVDSQTVATSVTSSFSRS